MQKRTASYMIEDNRLSGSLGRNAVHLCVDMQRMFAEPTEWMMPWSAKVLPHITALVAFQPEKTIFTRFIPVHKTGQGQGMWKKYYECWASMTVERLGADMLELVPALARFAPPASVIDKHVYMGCFLFQLPPSFHYSPARLRAILGQLDHSRRNVVEFRHASWWNETAFSAFRETGTIFCSCSGPGLPDDVIKTSDDIYVRFHGTHQWYRHEYSQEELSMWANRIRKTGAERVWAYFNNDRNAHAITNAKTLWRLLQKQAQNRA